MADVRRHGNIVGFWGTLATDGQTPLTENVQAGEFSRPQYVGQYGGDFAIYVYSNVANTVTLYTAHSSQLTTEGSDPGRVAPPWNYFYPTAFSDPNLTASYTLSPGVGISLLIPRFVPGWTMLKATGSSQLYAGWELATT